MNFKTKLLIISLLPILLIAGAMIFVIDFQSRRLEESQAKIVEDLYRDLQEKELLNYVALAEKAISPFYESRLKTKRQAQQQVKDIIKEMSFGEDNYFYIYDGNGKNIVNPRLTYLIGSNWIGLTDADGRTVVKDLIDKAKAGGDFYTYLWPKPSSGEHVPKLGYSIYLPKWDWMIGTGIYLDDATLRVQQVRSEINSRIGDTRLLLLLLTLGAVILTTSILTAARLSEQRFADVRLKQLTARIVEVQEEERKRVARELHDSIGQLLVSSRYNLEAAVSKVKDDTIISPLEKSIDTIDNTISEVRRISMALRPSILDELGLVSAIKSLSQDFEKHSGIRVVVDAKQPRKLITDEARTAAYRIIQEAFTNIIKHSKATEVQVHLQRKRSHFVLRLEDNGIGIGHHSEWPPKHAGFGIRNMQERIESAGGTIRFIDLDPHGLAIEILLPIDRTLAAQEKGLSAASGEETSDGN